MHHNHKIMSQILLLLGGNLGDVKNSFRQAITLLEQKLGAIAMQSSLYMSEAWGFESDDPFYNQVVEFNSTLPPHEILRITQETEKLLGRVEKTQNTYHSRTIDIDILFIDNMTVDSGNLTIPHPLLHKRRFTMAPLVEHWHEKKHPVLLQSLQELYEQCPDHSVVWKEGSYSHPTHWH